MALPDRIKPLVPVRPFCSLSYNDYSAFDKTNVTPIAVPFDSADADTGGMANLAAKRIDLPQAGWYRIVFRWSIECTGVAEGNPVYANIRLAGASVATDDRSSIATPSGGSSDAGSLVDVVEAAAGSHVTTSIYYNFPFGTGTWRIEPMSLSAEWIAPA
jgi:hypothetical protein